MKHTPTPWTFAEREYSAGIFGNLQVKAKPGRPHDRLALVAQFGAYTDSELDHQANAKRAIACVNACEGINPDALQEFIAAAKKLREKPITGDVLRFDLALRALDGENDKRCEPHHTTTDS